MPRHESKRDEARRPEPAKQDTQKSYRTERTPAEAMHVRPHDTYGCVDWFDYGRPETAGGTLVG